MSFKVLDLFGLLLAFRDVFQGQVYFFIKIMLNLNSNSAQYVATNDD